MQRYFFKLKALFWSLALLATLPQVAKAQLVIDDNVTAAQLVEKLVGTGVITMNPVLNCKTECAAIFEGPSNLGIDSGILLVTGKAKTSGSGTGVDAVATMSMSSAFTGPGDADLSAMLQGSASTVTNNACVLEFDFVPAGDTIKFDYVFGSEEYPEYACTSFNDVFGFLISGPGIVSNVPALPTKRNIAIVPGTTNIPVAINSINSGVGGGPVSNCAAQYPGAPYTAYYVDNLNPVGQHVVFDGFTTVLTAIQNVTPCDTYHLKLAVADVADGALNSGVFIKAGSLSSVGLTAGSQGMNITTSDTAFIVRGCPAAEVSISREVPTAQPLVVPYVLGGDAVNGVDVEYLNGTVTIPANETTGYITVKALPVPNPGPNKILKIYFTSPYSCGGNPNVLDSAIVSIQDSILLSMNVGDTGICLGQYLEVDIQTDSIYGPLHYEWVPTTGVTSNSINYAHIDFAQAGEYFYQYKVRIPSLDTNCRVSTASFTVIVQDIKVNIGDDTSICSYDRLQMFAEVFPQDTGGAYQYNWSPAAYFDNPEDVAPVILPGNTSSDIVVTVRTDIGCIGRDTIKLTVNPGEFVNVSPADTAICPGGLIMPRVSSSLEGTPLLPSYVYHWSPTRGDENPSNKDQAFRPEDDTRYMLTVTNEFGCTDTSFVDVVVHPNAVVQLPDSVTLWAGESWKASPYTNAVHFTWFPVYGISDPNIANPVFSPEVNTRYFYTAKTDQGCEVKDSIDIIVRTDGVFDMPNAFNPNLSPLKPVIRGNFTLEAFEIYDRWGTLVYSSSNINDGWDGTIKSTPANMGVYVYSIKAVNNQNGSRVQKTGNVTLIR